MSTRFVYLHGFNSAFDETNGKVVALKTLYDVEGITYDTFASHDTIQDYLLDRVSHIENPVFVGTSLGGYWAARIGSLLSAPSVAINPCHDPSTMLMKYVGVPHRNYSTGEERVLTSDIVDTYRGRDLTIFSSLLPLILLDMGDDVIDSHATANKFEHYPMLCHPGGSHRFDHIEQSLEKIRQYVNHCSYVDHAD
jgi:uncharacterized protein